MTRRHWARLVATVAVVATMVGCMARVSNGTITDVERAVQSALPHAVEVEVQHATRPGIGASRLEVYIRMPGPSMTPDELLAVLAAIDDELPARFSPPIAILLRVNASETEHGELGDIHPVADELRFDVGWGARNDLMFERSDLDAYLRWHDAGAIGTPPQRRVN